MGTEKKPGSRTVVGVSLRPEEVVELDRQREEFGRGRPTPTRPSALKIVWEKFGDRVVDMDLHEHSSAAADAERIRPVVEPLVAAMDELAKAWQERAHQRQMIGANKNQVARFANTLAMRLRDDDEVGHEDLERLVLALENIDRKLGEQLAKEREDDHAIAELRALLDPLRARA